MAYEIECDNGMSFQMLDSISELDKVVEFVKDNPQTEKSDFNGFRLISDSGEGDSREVVIQCQHIIHKSEEVFDVEVGAKAFVPITKNTVCYICLSKRINFAWGNNKALRYAEITLSLNDGISVCNKAFDADLFDNVIQRLSNVTMLKGRNTDKGREVKTASLNGKDIETPNMYPDVFENNVQIIQVKGQSEAFAPHPRATLTYNKNGVISIKGKDIPVLDTSDISAAYCLIANCRSDNEDIQKELKFE